MTQPSRRKEPTKQNGLRRIFISYKRNVQPDEVVAREVFEALSQHYDVFIDVEMPVGTRWAERIENELREADFFIAFLSSHSIQSEMILGEIETAYHLSKEHKRPVILPVRLGYQEPFQYPLSAYVNQFNWALWSGPEDTPRLIEELSNAISGRQLPESAQIQTETPRNNGSKVLSQPSPSAQPAALEFPEGTLDPQSHFYVERSSDAVASAAIERQGVTIVIKGPRQMGKSSLLIRTISAAGKNKKRFAFLDFQLFDRDRLTDADVFFRQFCSWLTVTLEMEDKTEEYWSLPLGNSQRCTRYVERHILKRLSDPLILAMDEVDSIFNTEFRTDFFSMLRSWHNSRSISTTWKQLDLALVTSTEPYQFIESLHQSPFNVGEVIDLEDFTPEQIAVLSQRHPKSLNETEQKKLFGLLGGHPYLVRRALYLVASDRITFEHLLEQATEDRGPFGDHLRYYLFRLQGKAELIEGLRQVIKSNTIGDELIFFRLRGAGLVRREGQKVLPRCKLYEKYFEEHLNA